MTQPRELKLVASSEYDAMCDLFRTVCEEAMMDEHELRKTLWGSLDADAVEWAVEVLNGASSRELFEVAP